MADTSVKFLHSELPGAPVLSGTAGSLIAVLDACLVNGWGLVTATSVVVAGGIATATFAAGHSFEEGRIVLVSGATPAALNGEQRLATTATNTVSWATAAPDGTATGTITVKLAPAGWIHPVPSGTNKATYKSSSPAATGCVLRVDDSSPRYARIRAYESMTDVDTGVGATPTDSQISGGLYTPKSNSADSTSRRWMIVATDKFAILMLASNSSYASDYAQAVFGDFKSLKAGDAYNCIIAADVSDTSGSNYIGNGAIVDFANQSGVYVVRSYSQSGGAINAGLSKPGVKYKSGDSYMPIGPNPINNALEIVPTLIWEGVPMQSNRRGSLPGLYGAAQYLGGAYDSKQTVTGVEGLAGHTLMGVRYYSASTPGRFFVDISGPWD